MIIPMVCFECGLPISHNYKDYLSIVDNYTKNPELIPKNDATDKRAKFTPEFMALSELKIGRECCRKMYITQQDMYQFIN